MSELLNTDKLRSLIAGTDNRLDMWAKVLSEAKPEETLEIGVWKGDFAEYILRKCPNINRYYMIDPWATLPDWNKPFNVEPKVFEEVYNEAMLKTEFAKQKITVLRGTTQAMIDDIPDASLDYAYIDGDHTLRGITIDLIKLLPKMKLGGLIGGDDFMTNPWQHSIDYEPTLVCPFSVYFAEAMDLPFYGLPYQQFLIQNRPDVGFSFTDLPGDYEDLSLNKLPETKKKRGLLGSLGLR